MVPCTVEMLPQDGWEVDVKRFYAPAIVRSVCPECGADVSRHLDDNYLGYPELGVMDIHMICYKEWETDDGTWDCSEHEFTTRIRMTIQVEAVNDTD